MGLIKAITDRNGCNQRHHCEAPKRSRDERSSKATRRAVVKPQGGFADKRDKGVVRTLWVSWRYSSRDNNHCQRSVDCRNASAKNTTTSRSSKQETSGRLGIFMPQISRDENIENNNKTRNEELAKKQNKMQPRDTCATCHARDTWWISNAYNWLMPSRATTKQARAAATTMKTQITIFILIKNWRQVVLLWFPLQAWPLTAKSSHKSEKKDTSPSFLDNDL